MLLPAMSQPRSPLATSGGGGGGTGPPRGKAARCGPLSAVLAGLMSTLTWLAKAAGHGSCTTHPLAQQINSEAARPANVRTCIARPRTMCRPPPTRDRNSTRLWCFSCSPSFLSHVVCASIIRDFEVEHREITAYTSQNGTRSWTSSCPARKRCCVRRCLAMDEQRPMLTVGFFACLGVVCFITLSMTLWSQPLTAWDALNRLAAVLAVDDRTRLLWRVPPVVRSHCAKRARATPRVLVVSRLLLGW